MAACPERSARIPARAVPVATRNRLMETCLHRVIGLFATRADADAARDELVRCGMPIGRVTVLQPGNGAPPLVAAAERDSTDLALLRDGARSAASEEQLALALDGVSLFAASPVLGALMVLGWRASLGALVPALADPEGIGSEPTPPPGPAGGHAVLVARADNAWQTALARRVVAAAMGEAAGVHLRAGPELARGGPVRDRRHLPERRNSARASYAAAREQSDGAGSQTDFESF